MGRRRSRKPDSGVSGCIICNKPAGITSHGVVDVVRKSLGTSKVGHAGTLDPDATGVLVIGVGAGTKLLQFVTGVDKRYVGEITFGTETSTLDASGEVTATYEMSVLPAEVQIAADSFVGDIEQIPPMVSAVRVNGKRLHQLAREGIEVERKPRPVSVFEFTTSPTTDKNIYNAEIHCSSGTYVRTLAADVGTSLGGGAHLSGLKRTSVGPFLLEEACEMEELVMLDHSELLRGMPVLHVEDDIARQVRNGRPLGPSAGTGRLAIKDSDDMLLAVYHVIDGELRPAKVLAGN